MPGHLTSFKVGGHFGAKGSSLNDRGAGDPKRRFSYASERSRSGTWSHHRHTESCKPNKTKQNKTSASAAMNSSCSPEGDARPNVNLVPYWHHSAVEVVLCPILRQALVPVSACAPARALSCTSSACVPECHSADLLTPVRCMDSPIRACVRACNTNTRRRHLQMRSAERKTLNCQLYIGSASFCMCGRN